MADLRATIESVFRQESGIIIAGLIRASGSFDLAEEAMQEAFATALTHWPASGVPQLWSCEAGEAGLGCRQSAVHQTIAFFVGRRCRASTLKDVAKELNSDWHTVKGLEKQYMRAQLAKARPHRCATPRKMPGSLG